MSELERSSLEQRLRASIRDIPDFPKPGILFKDITPALLDPALFRETVGALADWTREKAAAKVIGVDARGFLFAGAVADRLGIGLVPVRKPGKLPFETVSESYDLEYGVNTLELHTDAIGRGERIVVVDDLLATGGTVEAAVRLVEALGGSIVGLAFVVELGFLNGRARLDGYDTMSLVAFD
ncbi:MAG TPA: adenine phosphoribosyltransferase [Gemmatimonadota bacterium]|nr:adenine phosphoribosyltransferase [Gemmatimonadota bacterium]